MSDTLLRRVIHPEVRVLDDAEHVAEYVASDETVDSYREIIRAKGWRFARFEKNAPFVDSHDYSSIAKLVGKVLDFQVSKGRLIETVKWAADVADNKLAQLGWAMTKAGFLKAVSVGFMPTRFVTPHDTDPAEWDKQVEQLGVTEKDKVRRIYLEQEQYELSTVIIGANENALARSVVAVARAHQAGAVTDAGLEYFAVQAAESRVRQQEADSTTAGVATDPADATQARQRATFAILTQLHAIRNGW